MHFRAWMPLFVALVGCRQTRRATAAHDAKGPTPNLSAKVNASDTALLGIPLRELDTSWARADVSEHGVIVSDSGQRAFADSTVRQAWIDGDFNRDGQLDRAMVGTFRDHRGRTGPFVLVATQNGGIWRRAFATGMTGTAPKSFLRLIRGDTLVWNDCLDCDAVAVRIFWNGSAYVAKWEDQ